MSTFKAIRERLGVTQQEMADGLGCSQGNVSLYERGQTVLPETAKKLIVFAATRGVNLTYEDIYGEVRLPKRPVAAQRAPRTLRKSERPMAHSREMKGRA